jgi:hypothetical protein
MKVPAFSGVFHLCHRSEQDVLHNPLPLRSVPIRPWRGLIYRFLGFATLGEVVFEGVNLKKLQFRVEEKALKLTGTSKNFWWNYD